MFIPHTESETREMLKELDLGSIEDLFIDVPKEYRFPNLDLPPALSEMEAFSMVQAISQSNESTQDLICFLGAGAYNHYIPAVVDSVISRGEFFSAYTPYQPEISQGTLQAVFEYQSLIAALTGMDVSNASHYDGATACAEAGVLAYHHFFGKRPRIVISPSLHPHYRETMRTYLQGYAGIEILGDESRESPLRHPDELIQHVDQNTSLVLVQYPDFFGRIFDLYNFSQSGT